MLPLSHNRGLLTIQIEAIANKDQFWKMRLSGATYFDYLFVLVCMCVLNRRILKSIAKGNGILCVCHRHSCHHNARKWIYWNLFVSCSKCSSVVFCYKPKTVNGAIEIVHLNRRKICCGKISQCFEKWWNVPGIWLSSSCAQHAVDIHQKSARHRQRFQIKCKYLSKIRGSLPLIFSAQLIETCLIPFNASDAISANWAENYFLC